jgi:hypothetical protein
MRLLGREQKQTSSLEDSVTSARQECRPLDLSGGQFRPETTGSQGGVSMLGGTLTGVTLKHGALRRRWGYLESNGNETHFFCVQRNDNNNFRGLTIAQSGGKVAPLDSKDSVRVHCGRLRDGQRGRI